MKKIFKRGMITLGLCAMIIASSRIVTSAVTSGWYNLVPAQLGGIKYTASITKSNISVARNKNSAVQGSATMYSNVIYVADRSTVTNTRGFKSGDSVSMTYYNPSWYVGHDMQMSVSTGSFDTYGRNAYGYWSPDDF